MGVGLALMLGLVGPARAVNHLIVIDEVLASWQGDDAVQFVELRLLAGGQRSLSDAGGARGTVQLVFDDASASPEGRRIFTLDRDLDRAEAGARVLVATTALASISGIAPDFVIPPGLLAGAGGRICYVVNLPQDPRQQAGVIDCVSWGAYSGGTGRFGKPVALTPSNRALQRIRTEGVTATDWGAVLEPTPQSNVGEGVRLLTLCGDGRVSAGEECDASAPGGETCTSLGFARGRLECVQCHHDTSRCSFCGNDAINPGEECDGTDLGGTTCETLGFTGGTLACTEKCRLVAKGCDPTFFVPGGGPRGPECLAEWLVMNEAGRPGTDGRARVKQRCRDGDAGCDIDGVEGTCTFPVAVCFDRDDARLARGERPCRREPIARFTVLAPSAEDPRAAQLLAAAAALGPAALEGRDVTYTNPLEVSERCTDPVAVTVALDGRRRKLVLRTRTQAVGGRPRDRDTLRLVCHR